MEPIFGWRGVGWGRNICKWAVCMAKKLGYSLEYQHFTNQFESRNLRNRHDKTWATNIFWGTPGTFKWIIWPAVSAWWIWGTLRQPEYFWMLKSRNLRNGYDKMWATNEFQGTLGTSKWIIWPAISVWWILRYSRATRGPLNADQSRPSSNHMGHKFVDVWQNQLAYTLMYSISLLTV